MKLNGCDDPICKNKKGCVFNFDLLRTKIYDFNRKHKDLINKYCVNNNDDIDIEDDVELTGFEKILDDVLDFPIEIKCPHCNSEPFQLFNLEKKRNNFCEYCKGYGINFKDLEPFKID